MASIPTLPSGIIRASVGARLYLLMGFQTAIVAYLVLTALRTIAAIGSDSRESHEFQLQSIAAIGSAMEEAAVLKNGATSPSLEAFLHRYHTDWETAAASSHAAVRFRNELYRAGELSLAKRETEILLELKEALQSGNADAVSKHLAALHNLNMRFADLESQYLMSRTKKAAYWLLTVGSVATVLTLLLGYQVRRAIGPRIRFMVSKVREFRESGVYERIGDIGRDDIGSLANALDAGFSAISEREREREKFMSIAAHELKTPVTSIYGYASLLTSHPEAASLVPRTIEIIHRQSWRLSRLIDGLFLSAQARTGALRFDPKPFDMSALVERVLREMKPFVSEAKFSAQLQKNVFVLGDEALLEHALWSLVTCAFALSPDGAVQVALNATKNSARLTLDIQTSVTPLPELQELFLPFRSVQYETGASIRSAIGLYLSREIVKIHNGSLHVQQVSDVHPEFVMELPI
jgi:signal transduction histidine kinase